MLNILKILLGAMIVLYFSACGGGGGSSSGDSGTSGTSQSAGTTSQNTASQSTSKLTKTGQTTSYKDYDDGYYQKGLATNFTRGSDIVIDNITGLQWQDDEKIKTEAIDKTWNDAKTYCDNLTLGGYDDWRLPNIDELETIVDYGRYKNDTAGSKAAIDPIFENINSNDLYYWSSTPSKSDASTAWAVGFNDGNDLADDKTTTGSVRCVR